MARLVPWKESYVRYEDGDLIGLVYAIITLIPLYGAIGYLTVFLFRRDIQTLFILSGQCFSIIISSILKDIIGQPRPLTQDDLLDYGMPSSHAVFASYLGTIIILQIYAIPSRFLHNLLKFIYISVVIAISCAACASRVYLGYHYFSQVLVGAILGGSIAVLWYRMMTSRIIRILFKYLCSTRIGRYLMIRDYSHVGYASVEEYHAMMASSFK